jgi:hypothetical protein
VALFWLFPALAQQPAPHLGYVYPAGGRQGTSFQATVGGQFLAAATNAHFSHPGLTAKVLDYSRPLTQKEANELKEKAKALQAKRAALEDGSQPGGTNGVWTAADRQTLATIRKKLAGFRPRAQINPAIAERVTIQVDIGAQTAPGRYELRLETAQGFSNPMAFEVGQLPEVTKPAAHQRSEMEPLNLKRPRQQPAGAASPTEAKVMLPAAINGQIMPGGVDRYRFSARKGQRIVIATNARQLIPYLPDAVPGWFQASVSLYDSKGREMDYADHFLFHPDPVLAYEMPQTGEYTLEIHDSIHRGREDFVYRISIGELPYITSVFPLGSQIGQTAQIAILGWNLGTSTLTQAVRPAEAGTTFLCITNGTLVSNPTPIAAGTLEEHLEQEPNETPGQNTPLGLPCVVNGRIGSPGDVDRFRFDGRAGLEIVAEITARRLNSPLDSLLKLTSPDGEQVALNDDHEDKGSGLLTHHADSYLRLVLPKTGVYTLSVADAQQQGGPAFGYRLRLSPPQPDFELRLTPSCLNVRAGATVPATVYVFRKDGFTNEISLTLRDAPTGLVLGGPRVPAGQDQVRITITAPAESDRQHFHPRMEGRARLGDREIVRPVIAAEDMMQAFSYRHLVPSQELTVAVPGRGLDRGPLKVLSAAPIRIPAGGTAAVRLNVPGRLLKDRLRLELSDPPEGITLEKVEPSAFGTEIIFHADNHKLTPGAQGNLILYAFPATGEGRGKRRPDANRQKIPLTALPAIPYDIVAGR